MKVGIAALGFLCFLVSFVWSALVFGVIGFISNGTWLHAGDPQMIAYWLALAFGPQMLLAGVVAFVPLAKPIRVAVIGGFLLGMLAILLTRML